MEADTSEKIRDVISFVHSRTLSIGVYSPGDISVTNMYEEAASDLAEIIQQEIAKARLDELENIYDHYTPYRQILDNDTKRSVRKYAFDRIAELSQTLKEHEEKL